MSDDDGLFDRLRARLAPTQDGSASPQARDERPTVVGREEYREEVDEQQIETFVTEYYRNPLVRVPVQNFASDVTEPGVSVDVAPRDDDGDIPTVEYDGRDRPLDEALSAWASSCFIDGFRFDGDFADLLEEAVKDRRGRRGTSIVEHAYDDPRERERLLGLKPLKTETVTAYTREGKAIVLRPDDDPGSFDTVAVRDYGDATRDEAPMTPAGKTAAIAQFDDVFGAQEREEIPFALDDVTVSPHDADTGELFGRPDSSPVIERARALRKKLRYVDQSVVNTALRRSTASALLATSTATSPPSRGRTTAMRSSASAGDSKPTLPTSSNGRRGNCCTATRTRMRRSALTCRSGSDPRRRSRRCVTRSSTPASSAS